MVFLELFAAPINQDNKDETYDYKNDTSFISSILQVYRRIVGSRRSFFSLLSYIFVLHLESLFVLVVLLPFQLFLHLGCYFEVLSLDCLRKLFRSDILCVFIDRGKHADAIVLIFIGSFAIADGSNVLKFTL